MLDVLEKAGLVEPGWTMLMQIINFIILFFIIKKFLFVPVMNIMEKRKSGIENTLNEAERKNKEAEDYKLQYDQKLQTAELTSKEIIDKAVKNANLKAEEIVKEAKIETVQMKAKAENDIEYERKKALNEIKDEISSIAVLAASKIMESEIDVQKNTKIVDKFIEEVGEVKWQN